MNSNRKYELHVTVHVRNTLFRMKSNLNCLNNSRNCQNKSNMQRAIANVYVRVNYREGGLYVIYSPEDAQRPRAVYHIQPNFEVIN